MAPKPPSKNRSKSSSSGSQKPPNKRTRPSSSSSSTKPTSRIAKQSTKQAKTKPPPNPQRSKTLKKKPRHRIYTESELNLPTLNTIVPASAAAKPRGSGKQKNKIYVDDAESMMTILALVNAEKEGQIESKMIKLRRMEEIREARRVEGEREMKRREGKAGEKGRGLKRKSNLGKEGGEEEVGGMEIKKKTTKKRVSFA